MAGKKRKAAAPEPWEGLPQALRERGERRWRDYLEVVRGAGQRLPRDPAFRSCLCRIFAISEFVADSCTRNPELLPQLLESGELLADSGPGVLARRVGAQLAACSDETQLRRVLRQLRRREMVRIAWRDLAGWAPLEETLADLSDLADSCIQGALERLQSWQAQQTPPPLVARGRPAPLVVIAMGKLGARELNFSSDIDLIFAWPDARPARRRGALEPEEYFVRLGRSLVQVLSEQDHDGFVFRVDMRLRPYGSAGALACSFEALEEYYQSQGREWERYAMIKARPVTGDEASRAQLMELLRPFVYRRYLDFRAFDALRDLKRQIQREVARKGLQDSLKLGPGGIREVEFIAQAFQLVRGGRDARLRRRGVVETLRALADMELLPAKTVDGLVEAWRFLRRAENRLQELHDRQVHHLPQDEGERLSLALAMGFDDWKEFLTALNRRRRRVEACFAEVFAAPGGDDGSAPEPLEELWLGRLPQEEIRPVLEEAGFDDPDEALRWIRQLQNGTAPRYLGEQGRALFDALVPAVLAQAGRQPQAAEVLGRLVQVLEHIAGRTTYLALLQERPQVLSQLVQLCAASPWIAQQIARLPMLLDQLLDPRSLYAPLRREELEQELERRLQEVDATDLEQQMDRLRQFRHAMVLRVAAADVAGAVEVTRVSDELTAIAETVLRKTLSLAWAEMVRRYGEPRCRERGRRRRVAFGIIGYGKLGGLELGYGSDLDLVFLHDSRGTAQHTAGRKAVDNGLFFTRLGQRVIHMLETFTSAGALYEVDMRLRPSGNSGMLVSSLDAFADYQRGEAWTWEHQALVRARPVAGDGALAKAFGEVRAAVLRQPRDPEQLRSEVREMRERMRAELGRGNGGRFHLKQGRGGIVDIEFMVQYLVLRWCREHAELLRHTDTIHLLKALSNSGLLRSAWAQTLIEAYRRYRALNHRLTLAEAPPLVEAEEVEPQRDRVADIWAQLMER